MNALPRLIFIATVCTLSLPASNLTWVDQQIAAIKPKRVGMSDTQLSRISNPMKYQKIVQEDKEDDTLSTITATELAEPIAPLKVAAILNNSALIDGKWLKVSDSVRGYRIKAIHANNVLLQNKKQKLKLFIKEKNDKIKIQIN